MNDWELLREYVQTRSQPAFAQIVERHLRWVHAACARQTRDPHLAEDVTQAVFLLLAQKAGGLKPDTPIAGWLFRTARLTCTNAIKMERRRIRRETQVAVAARRDEPRGDLATRNESEMLDALYRAMARLRAQDRDMLVLRFYNGKSVSEAAEEMGVSLEAAKKRFARSLVAVRQALADQGVAVPAVGGAMTILGAFAPQSSHAVPAGLNAWVAGGAASSAASARASEIVRRMILRKLFMGLSVATATVLMVGIAAAVAGWGRPSTRATAAMASAPTTAAAPVRAASSPAVRTLSGHTSWIIAAAMSPNGRYGISRSANQLLRWDLQSGAAVGQPVTIREQPIALAVSNAGKIVAVDRPDLLVFDTFDAREPRRLPPSDRRVMHWSLALSPDGSQAVAGGADGVIRLIDLSSGAEIRALRGHSGVVVAVAFAPDGRTLLSGAWDKTARLWDVAGGKELHRFAGHTSAVHGVAFSDDGRSAATFARSMTGPRGKSSADKFVRVWGLDTGKQKLELPVPTDEIQMADFAVGGQRVVALVGRIWMAWDATDGHVIEQRSVLPEPASPTCVAVSADLNYLLAGGGGGPERKDLLFLVP